MSAPAPPQAKALGDELVVGLIPDSEARARQGSCVAAGGLGGARRHHLDSRFSPVCPAAALPSPAHAPIGVAAAVRVPPAL